MTFLQASIALLAVAAVVVLVGGLLWNGCEQLILRGDQRAGTRGLMRLGRFLCLDAGLLVAGALGCYLCSRLGLG